MITELDLLHIHHGIFISWFLQFLPVQFLDCFLAEEKYMSNDGCDQHLMDHQHTSDNLSHNFSSRPLPCANPRFNHMMGYKFGYPMKYNTRIPSCQPNQGGRQQFPQARSHLDVNLFEEIIKGDDSEQKESLVSIFQDSVFMLMLSRRL
ncbi:UNVERIFIED_CONTAM: hypothetical protein Slati_0811900 [Sesamum latifolium]|uniref:Uncharacterized protein n=1 Tax=Sesamum latifolium TaxID=2727402 RepID=A0AAW2XP53_9LAMI